MKRQENLLDKYYQGETSCEEEEILKEQILHESFDSAEKDMFGYFQKERVIPEDLETHIFEKIQEKQVKGKSIRMKIISWSSAAAVLIVFATGYFNFRHTKNTKIENDFFVMEQALYQVSESIQPEEQEEMFVLWVDSDVEIIIN